MQTTPDTSGRRRDADDWVSLQRLDLCTGRLQYQFDFGNNTGFFEAGEGDNLVSVIDWSGGQQPR